MDDCNVWNEHFTVIHSCNITYILDDRNDRFDNNRPQYTFDQKAADKANKPKGEYWHIFKVGYVLPMVITSGFWVEQHKHDDHQEDALLFNIQ